MTCDHKIVQLRKKPVFFGRGFVYLGQCITCLKAVGPKSRENPKGPESTYVPFWVSEKPKKRPNSKGRKYEAHLRSRYWKKVRQDVLIRDNWTCRYCGEPATEVDHRHYESFGHEKKEDLVASCRTCNLERRVNPTSQRGARS